MIPVPCQPEYREFDLEVRKPGKRLLRENPGARKLRNLWSKATVPELK